ncbi:MAG: IncP-type conjugal transfer protein TraG [Myxococcales bacterium]|nr:IncP-type conjugal transfer protein TraG [Myxococcales bacterium]
MLIRAVIIILSIIFGCWSSSVLLVSRLGNEISKSQVWFSIGDIHFFAPWLWAKWFFLYGARYKDIFFDTMWPICISVLLGITTVWLLRILQTTKNVSNAHGSARFASDNEIIKSGLVQEHGIVLGQKMGSRDLLCHDGPEHVLVVAPTRGGKGVGIVIPTLLNWKESVIIFDPKGENWEKTSGHRSTLGRCLCFNPTSSKSSRFNPLMEIRKGDLEVKDVQNIADIIVDPDGRLDFRNHWQNAAHSLLVGTILHVLYSHPRKSLTGVLEFLTTPEVSFVDNLEDMSKSEHHIVKSVAQEMLNKHIEERSGVLSTAVSLLSIFRDPIVANATDHHDFEIKSLKKDKTPLSLYLVLPPSDISRLRVLLRMMLNQIGRVLTEEHNEYSEPSRKVLFLLDEFPALGRLEFFETALAYMAGYGLNALIICQSLNQLQKAYGERNSILDNCHVRVAFANNDEQTARRLSNMLGEQTVIKEQTSYSGARFSMFKPSSSIAKIEYGRPLLFPAEINRLPSDQELILINGLFPVLANKVRYYQDKRFIKKLLKPSFLEEKEEKIPLTNNPLVSTLSGTSL